jgi:protein-S-isoprenylcysteine O-methyltransferase Ste14
VTPARRVMVAQAVGFPILVAVVLFAAAGRVDLPLYWAYVGVVAGISLAGPLLMDEDLARERMRPGGRPPGLGLRLAFLACLLHWAIAGLDRGRLHWSDGVPPPLQVAGLVVFAAGTSFTMWPVHVNRFFSSAVRIQSDRGQHVVDHGPYRWLRHPGYAGAIPALPASGLALCSWLAAAVGLLGSCWLLWRTVAEDRMLRTELPGYDAYARRVRWRLLPGVW